MEAWGVTACQTGKMNSNFPSYLQNWKGPITSDKSLLYYNKISVPWSLVQWNSTFTINIQLGIRFIHVRTGWTSEALPVQHLCSPGQDSLPTILGITKNSVLQRSSQPAASDQGSQTSQRNSLSTKQQYRIVCQKVTPFLESITEKQNRTQITTWGGEDTSSFALRTFFFPRYIWWDSLPCL